MVEEKIKFRYATFISTGVAVDQISILEFEPEESQLHGAGCNYSVCFRATGIENLG